MPGQKISLIDDGYLPNFEGEPVIASCENCTHCEDVSDGWEYGPPCFDCNKKPHMSNLKGFPFKTSQKCCELHYSFMVDWDAQIKKEGWNESEFK